MEESASTGDAYGAAKASKFRLKSKSKRKHREADGEDQGHKRHRSDDHSESRSSRREGKRRNKHRSGRTVHDHTFSRNGEYDDPDHRYRESLYDGIYDEAATLPEEPVIDPDQAFRESLFDALADDEGASYWEGVYGQPVHVYSDTKRGPDGKLERMSEEEYAEYVRTKMWEKSHQHIVEEREERERRRKRDKDRNRDLEEETARQEQERENVRRQMQDSLRRGEERKKAREAEAAWLLYFRKWDELKERKDLAQEDAKARELIPWPVISGKIRHISKEEIEQFFESSMAWKADAMTMLKTERVRWHPDKMQQRFGQHIDPETMKSVTVVFQVVDNLWNQRRKTK
jgi:hypothetical protein